MPSRVVNGEWQRRFSGWSSRTGSTMGDISQIQLARAGGNTVGSGQRSAAQSSSEHLRAVQLLRAAVLVLAETLKKLLLFIPKTLPRRLFRPTRALGDLAGHGGVKLGLDRGQRLAEADE